jgi:RimJ/RimL family protein N-acetyltransferase
MYRVRDAQPNERARIAALIEPRWGATIVSRGRVHTLNQLPALVADERERIIGCLLYEIGPASATEVVTLDSFLPRQGVATALLTELRSRYGGLWLITTNDNIPAQRLYEKLGMKLTAVHRNAVAESRRLKPSIPLLGYDGIPIKDEIQYEWPDTMIGRPPHARMHYSDYTPTTDPTVLATLERWFRANPEILVRTRGQCSGREEFELFTSFKGLITRTHQVRPYTWFTIWEQPQLPLRGIVDDEFMTKCMSHIPEEAEFLIVETILTVAGAHCWIRNVSGDLRASFCEELEEMRGAPVAVGVYPPCLEERDDVIHAFTPDAEGIVKPGPY